MISYCYIWVDDTVFTDVYMVANKTGRVNKSAFPDRCAIAYRFRGWFERAKMLHDLTISFKRLICYQQRFSLRHGCLFIDDDKACCAVDTLVVIFWMVNKNEIAFFHIVYLINAGCIAMYVAGQICFNKFGYPFNRNRRGEFHIQ